MAPHVGPLVGTLGATLAPNTCAIGPRRMWNVDERARASRHRLGLTLASALTIASQRIYMHSSLTMAPASSLAANFYSTAAFFDLEVSQS